MRIRTKLMAAVVMLIISAIMMTTASFAWFTISTAPEVVGLTTEVVVNDNLEIALHTKSATVTAPAATAAGQSGNAYTWGNQVNLEATNKLNNTAGDNEYTAFMEDVVLRPVASATDGFDAPKYSADGRITTIDATVTEPNDQTYGYGTINGTQTNDDNVYGYYVDLWVRTNVGGNLVLTDATPVADSLATNGAGSTVDSSNTHFEKAMNIAVKKLGSYSSADTPVWTAATGANYVSATNDGDGTLSSETLVALTANEATLIRVYVFLDGTKVTNQDASVTGQTAVTGAIDLQFKLNGVTMNDMDSDLSTAVDRS